MSFSSSTRLRSNSRPLKMFELWRSNRESIKIKRSKTHEERRKQKGKIFNLEKVEEGKDDNEEYSDNGNKDEEGHIDEEINKEFLDIIDQNDENCFDNEEEVRANHLPEKVSLLSYKSTGFSIMNEVEKCMLNINEVILKQDKANYTEKNTFHEDTRFSVPSGKDTKHI